MKAMILAAGLGTRLRPLTDTLPKPLLPLAEKPLIEYTLLLLRKFGVADVMINLHHRGDQIRQALGDGARWGMTIRYSEEPRILGTGGGIKKVETFLSDGPFLVINGDILAEINLDQAVEFHQRKKAAATLVLREDPEADAPGGVGIDSRQRVRQLRNQPAWTGGPLAQRMFSGIHVMDPRVLSYIPPHGFSDIIHVYIEMLKKGEGLFGHPLKGYWTDIGTPDRYEKAQDDLRCGRARLTYLKTP